jgi:hypothetical protein
VHRAVGGGDRVVARVGTGGAPRPASLIIPGDDYYPTNPTATPQLPGRILKFTTPSPASAADFAWVNSERGRVSCGFKSFFPYDR